MNIKKLKTHLLLALEALLIEENVSRAANKINITQAAMSNALSDLRNIFSDELLVRFANSMQLTPKALK